jgi:hypothetical protein
MTTRPLTADSPVTIAGPGQGRLAGNGAVPDVNVCPREADCRKDRLTD